MVAFPGNDVGTGQCLELLPEPGSQLWGLVSSSSQAAGVTAGSIPLCRGFLVGYSSPGSLLELIQEHCLALSEGKEKQAATQRQIFPCLTSS